MKLKKHNYEEIVMYCDTETPTEIDRSYPIIIRRKNKTTFSNCKIAAIIVLVSILVLMLSLKLIIKSELADAFEKNFAELERFESDKQMRREKISAKLFQKSETAQNLQTLSAQVPLPEASKLNIIPPNKPSPNINIKQTVQAPAQGSIAGITPEQLSNAKEFFELKNKPFPANNIIADKERAYYETKYQISTFTKELPFCIVIPSFNNMKDNRYKRNLDSVLMQEYNNYHIVYINDASTDGTGEAVEKYFKEQTISGLRYVIVHNKQQQFAMPNLRMAAKTLCRPDDIYMAVDGDDELLGRQVFKFFNSRFQAKELWFMYTNWYSIRGTVGYSRPIPPSILKNNKIRTYPFVMSHLRAFYTQIFRNIHEEDLKDEKSEYFHSANDVAIMLPIIEQSGTKVEYIPEITYFYNANTGLNNHQIRTREQKMNDQLIRKKKVYSPISKLEFDLV